MEQTTPYSGKQVNSIQLTSITLVQIGSSNVNFNPFSYTFIHITIPKMLILMDYDVFNALRIFLYISQNVKTLLYQGFRSFGDYPQMGIFI